MTQLHIRALPLFAIISILCMVSSVVYAKDSQDTRSDSNGGGEDTIVQQDRATYAQLHLDTKFGVQVRSHKDVCSAGAQGDAHCNARVITDSVGNPATTPDVMPQVTPRVLPAGKSPAQLLKAYNLTGQASGHPVIAIVDAYDDPNIANDLNTYSTTYGIAKLPTCTGAIANSAVACFQKVNQSGKTTGLPTSNAGWALEIALDVEVAHATCQNCSIVLVEASSASYTNLMSAVDQAVALGAKVVSNSWGSSEFLGQASYDSHFNHPGIAFTVSSGDSGYGVQYPASSPYVTAVGGTSLFLNANGSYNSEVAWSGSGSGCSAYEPKPASQVGITPTCVNRVVADVAADADPNTGAAVYDTVRYGGASGWFQVGGTSLAAPLVAGVYALSGNTGSNTVAANSIPYTNALVTKLHDISSGSNGSCGGTYLCTALAGFDGPTGLGTPLGIGAF